MAQFFEQDNKFFEVGQVKGPGGFDRSTLLEVSEADVIGRAGDPFRTIEDVRANPLSPEFLRPLDFQNLKTGINPELSKIFGRNITTIDALGTTGQVIIPEGLGGQFAGNVPESTAFADFLRETGQVGGPQNQVLATVGGGGQFDATTGPNPFQSGGQFGNRQFARSGNDVFEIMPDGTRRAVTGEEFESSLKGQGLNLDVLPQLTAEQKEVGDLFEDGAVFTGAGPQQQAAEVQQFEAKIARVDDAAARLINFVPNDAEIEQLEKLQADFIESAKQGLIDIEGQAIPMEAIIGQQLLLEKRANAKLERIQSALQNARDDKEQQFNILKLAYDVERNRLSDTLKLFEATSPEKLFFDERTGTMFFSNPITGEVTGKKLPGFEPQPEGAGEKPTTSAITEYEFAREQGYQGSFQDWQTLKAGQFGFKQAPGAGGVAGGPTGSASQFVVANFASRIQQSLGDFARIESDIAELSTSEFFLQKKAPRALKSDTMRQFLQAEENMITAILRRESGAAISPEEFVTARSMYIPQPGDDEGTLLQKKFTRDLVLRNFINEAGTAFEPIPEGGSFGQQGTQPQGGGQPQNISDEAAQSVYNEVVAPSKIETLIADLGSSGNLRDSDIRHVLRQRGFTNDEINSSSVKQGFITRFLQ